MSLSRVQATPKATADSQPSVSVTFATAPTNGNGIVVGVLSSYGGGTGFGAAACTDNRGNTYTKVIGRGGFLASESVTVYYCPKITATGAPFTITIAPAVGNVDFTAGAIEVGGVGGGLAVNSAVDSAGIGTTAAQTTATLTAVDVVGFAGVAISATQGSLVVSNSDANTPGWTQEIEELSLGPVMAGEIDSRVVPAALGQLQVNWTGTATGWWVCVVVAFAATVAPVVPEPLVPGILAFTFNGEYPMKFCTADGVEVPPPTIGARIGDDDPPSYAQGGIMVRYPLVFGVTGVEVSGVVRSQVWPADLATLTGETVGSLRSIASNRTDRFYGFRHALSPAPDGLPEHAGVLPQPPVPTGITISVSLNSPASGSPVLPGFYEYGVLMYTNPVYPHPPNAPTSGDGMVIVGPLASLTVPTPPSGVGYTTNFTVTFPNPATMSPYFAGGWSAVARKNGGDWYITFGGSPSGSSGYDGVLPYPSYPGWGGFGPGRFVGSVTITNGNVGYKVGDISPYPTTNTTATGPWNDATLVEFDDSGALTGNEWTLFHLENQGAPTAIAVDRDATVAYFDSYDATTGNILIKKTVLSTSAISTFATSPSSDQFLYTTNSIRVLASGDVLVAWTSGDDVVIVKRYSSAGAVLATYPIAAAGWDALLSHGVDDSNFWVCYTDTDTYIDRLVNIDVATGDVLHLFDSPWFLDEEWNYNASPFCVIPGEPPPEPEEPETLFNPDEAAIVGLTWVEFTDSNNVLHVWAGIALPDPITYYGGYKAPSVIEWDAIRRGLSNIDGAYEGIAWSWLMSDTDRAIRRMLANELTKWFFNRNVVGRTITDPGRRALETPRTIFRGVVREWQPMAQGLFSFAAEDYMVTTFQIGTDEQQCPKRSILAADFPTCPEENIGRPVPVIYGNLSDKDEVTHIVPGVPGTASTVGLNKPTNFTATVRGGAGSTSYTYGLTALDNRNKQYNVYSKNTDHAGETDAAYVTVNNAPSLSQMSSTRYVELDWTDSVGAYYYRIYGRAVNGGTSLNLLDSARGPGAGSPERYNDGERHGETEVDREKTNSHPPAKNNTVVSGTPDVPESSYITDSGRGVVPVVHVGQRIVGGTPWYEFLVCGHAIKAVTAVYQADADSTFQPSEQKVIPIDPSLETDAGVKSVAPITVVGGIRVSDAECNVGGSLLVPGIGNGWTSTVGAAGYVDYNGHRYTVIYARNTIGEKAALNEQPLYLNVAGIEDQGNGTGTVITSLLDQYLHVMQNWLIGDYQTGLWLPSPVFPDEPSLPQIDAASFTTAKVISEQRIPGGYVGSMQFGVDGTFSSLRDAIALMNVSCDVNSGFNYRTQFIVSMQSEEISSLGAAQAVTQIRDIIRDTFNIESLVSEFFNRIPFQYGFLPENGTSIFYTEVKDPTSIAASLETRSSQTRLLPFVRNAPIAFDIARRFLMRSKDVPRRVTWEQGMSGLNFELGDIVLVTHLDGIGLNGYEATPIRVTRQDYNPQNYTVSIEGYDVGQFFSDAFILGDEGSLSSSWATATAVMRTYGYVGDETTGAFNDGARAKRLR